MKTELRRFVLALALLLVLTLPGPAAAVLSPVVATINGNPITGEDFNWAMNRMQRILAVRGEKVTEDNLREIQQQTLQGLLKNELLFVESEALGLKIDQQLIEQEFTVLKGQFAEEEEFNTVLEKLQVSEGTIRRQIMRGFAVRHMLQQVFLPEVRLEADAAENYFNAHPDEFHQPELVRVRHILVKLKVDASADDKSAAKAKLAAVRKRLEQGEEFAAVAASSSDCASAANGGDLGYFRKGQLAPVLDTVVFALKPQQLSGIVESPFGYHLLQVTERKEPRDLPLAEIKEDLEKRLILRQAQLNAAAFGEERLASAEVKIFFDELKAAEEDKKDE